MTEAERKKLNTYLSVLANGNAEILDAIYLLAGGRMFALAKGITKNHADAEDVVSESVIKIARNIRKFNGDNGYAWVMKITRNVALDFLRKKGIRAEENIDDIFSLSSSDYDEEKIGNAITLEAAIKKLSPAEQRLIYYTYYLDMTVREAAKNAGISKSAAQRNIEAAEKKLKLLLSDGTNCRT